jgi:hypothetical protein
VASNSNVNFNGASTTVDKVVLYNNTAAGNQCNANGNSGACANVTTLGPKLDLASAASMAFIDDQIAKCESTAVAGVLQDWVASKNGSQMNGLTGAPQCFNSLNFDVDTAVVNPPAVIFVKRGVNFEKQKYINCGGCPGTRPAAARLQIFSAGTQNLNDSSQDVENVASAPVLHRRCHLRAPRLPASATRAPRQVRRLRRPHLRLHRPDHQRQPGRLGVPLRRRPRAGRYGWVHRHAAGRDPVTP